MLKSTKKLQSFGALENALKCHVNQLSALMDFFEVGNVFSLFLKLYLKAIYIRNSTQFLEESFCKLIASSQIIN